MAFCTSTGDSFRESVFGGLTRLSIAQNKERQPGILENFRLMNVSKVKVCHATIACTSNRLSLPIRPVYIGNWKCFWLKFPNGLVPN